MRYGFPRREPQAPPAEIRPESIALPTPLKIPTPEPKPWWIAALAIGVVGLIIGMVVVSFASGARTFNGGWSVLPVITVVGVVSMVAGRFGGGSEMSRGKMDALRARFTLVCDQLRERISRQADALDENYRWYHPPVHTLEAAIGGRRMWERNPEGKDTWFGVARIGVGVTAVHDAGVVTFSEPQDMPTDVEMEPATGKVLQEFVRYQSVAYRVPALVSLLVEPGYRLAGPRERVLAVMRAMLCQLVFSHGDDHLKVIVVTDERATWDWVKWLPHVGDADREDAAGPVRMVYDSVAGFWEAHRPVIEGQGAFAPRHGGVREAVEVPHYVVIADIDDPSWYGVIGPAGVKRVTFFDLRNSVRACQDVVRLLAIGADGMVRAVPRNVKTGAPSEDGELAFFALADQMSAADAERFAMQMARWRLAESYEEDADAGASPVARDVLAYYGISDAAEIDFAALWATRSDILSKERLLIPIGNRMDNGALVIVDAKELDDLGNGPHGVMSGFTGSGKTTAVRTVLLALMLGHPPQNLQIVAADCKGGSGVKPFVGVPHVAHVITDLESDQTLLDRFVDALWGEIAIRKEICDSVGADDAREYNRIRADRIRRGLPAIEPMPVLFVLVDEFKEFFRLKADALEALQLVGMQGRAYWIHMLLASQEIDSKAEKLLENVGYRIVLRQNTPAAAAAAGVPQAVHLPAEVGMGYLRLGPADNLTKMRTESLWREYRKPGARDDDDVVDVSVLALDYLEPQLFTTELAALPEKAAPVLAQTNGAAQPSSVEDEDPDDDEGDALLKPKVGRVIIDQLRRIEFTPRRLWCPPLTQSRPIDEVVQMRLGRPWDQQYGSVGDLVFAIGVIDRPFKHDQQPLLVDTGGSEGANVLIIGADGAGKTVALQSLICSAAMTHTPEQVQFYCLAFSSAALATVAGLPHVGAMVYQHDGEGVRRTVSELNELLESRRRSFDACGGLSVEQFRRRRFGGEAGAVPDDRFGDVYLVIDNYGALTMQDSTVRNAEALLGTLGRLINDGPSFGIHVIVSVQRDGQLNQPVRALFRNRVELKLAESTDARRVKSAQARLVPDGRPGRGMVAQNYVRAGWPEVGLHTMIARPALHATAEGVVDSAGVVEAVKRVAARCRAAAPVRRLTERIELAALHEKADGQQPGNALVFGLDEYHAPVCFDPSDSPYLLVTGRDKCGRTTTLATLMTEIKRRYAPGGSKAVVGAHDKRPRAQVWLIDGRRRLTRVLGSQYVERFAYRPDEMELMAAELVATLTERMPRAGLDLDASRDHSWSGPEIFLIIDDAHRLPPGLDSPLRKMRGVAMAASDVGLRIFYARQFGGFNSMPPDVLLPLMKQADAPLLVMDSNPDEGYVRGRWKGHPMPPGRGFLLQSEGFGRYLQVAVAPAGEEAQTGSV